MSIDPSPWAEFSEPFPEGDRPTTAEMLKDFYEQHMEEERVARHDKLLWEKYAQRMTLDGRLL